MFPTRYSSPLTGLNFLDWYGAQNTYHPGVDFNYGEGWDDYGQEVYAAKSGLVIYVHDQESNSAGFGKFVILRHEGSTYTRYAHLRDVKIEEAGLRVQEGAVIGHVGKTGHASSPHLHFEVFGERMADIQRGHWRRWRYYPVGKSKHFVSEHYLNPWEWLKSETEKSIFEDARKWAMENKISNGERAMDNMTREEFWQMLKNYHARFHQGGSNMP